MQLLSVIFKTKIYSLDRPPWVNFTSILGAAFMYKSFVQSFFVLEVKVKLYSGPRKLAQLRSNNVGEIDSFNKWRTF